MNSLNTGFFLFINGLSGNRAPDTLFSLIAETAPYLCALFLIFFYLHGKRDQALYAFYTAVLGLMINFVITVFYFHPRPFMVRLGQPLLEHSPEASFPSDHATIVFSLAFSLLFSGERLIGIFFLLFAVATGFARVYCGIHFPLDVAGSILVSLASGLVVKMSASKLERLNFFLNGLYAGITERRQPELGKGKKQKAEAE